MTLLPGTKIGRYEIRAKIGAGGMGEVYLAQDTALDRKVALKILPAVVAANRDRMERFNREAKAAAALNHPHIAHIYEIGETEGTHFIAMEFIDGETLRDKIHLSRTPLSKLLKYLAQVAEGLSKAHAAGIVHRDLKPDNVMITRDDYAKVLDFGLAKLVEANPESDLSGAEDPTIVFAARGAVPPSLSTPGLIMGTIGYMSPEQASGRIDEIDHRSDIFSFGCLLFEAATGQRPFQGKDALDSLHKIVYEPAPQMKDTHPLLPADLQRVVRRCLAKEREKRYQSIKEVAIEIEELQQEMKSHPELEDASQRVSSRIPILSGAKSQPQAANTSSSFGNRPAVVVLPFANRSADPDNEYFSDGLTEEIISYLSRIEALRVISRNSSMTLKGTTRDTLSIAQELGVSHIVSGSVRRMGDDLRVTAELIDVVSDTSRWSEIYAGTMANVFAIQEEIAQKIVAALRVKLTDLEIQQAMRRPIEDAVAYDCYLRARQEMYRWTPDALDRASRLVDQALEIVGENSMLLATKGQIHWNKINVMIDPDQRHLDQAADYARRALALDESDYLGLFLRGIVAGLRGDGANALRDIYRAYQLRPGDPNVLAELCRFANTSGISVDHYVKELVAIDPLTPVTWCIVQFNHVVNGRFDEAVPAARRILELASGPSPLQIFAASTLAIGGLREEAIPILEMVGNCLAGTLHGSWANSFRYALAGDAERTGIEMGFLLEHEAGLVDLVAWGIAASYSLIGRTADSLSWIRKGMDRGFINYPFLSTYDPLLANVRSDPRFAELMVELKTRWEVLAQNLPAPLRAQRQS
jgi:serine/threonine protein kinase